MERMTFQHPTGRVWLKECDQYGDCDGECWYCRSGIMQRAMERLAAYEKTGLEPQEVVIERDQVQT